MLSTMIKKWRGERPSIFILSGAGLSVESGIPAYRGEGSDPDNDSADLSSTYMRLMPKLVYEAANKRIRDFDACEPNAAHRAIAQFVKKYRLRSDIVHVTQNIDLLCEEAGDTSVFHLHGNLNRSFCQQCGSLFPRKGFYKLGNVCPTCGAAGSAVRPDVVLYGEDINGWEWVKGFLNEVDIFIAIGTSGTVYPAADFVSMAYFGGASVRMLLNKGLPLEMEFNWVVKEDRYGPYNYVRLGAATAIVPMVLKEVGKLIENIPVSNI